MECGERERERERYRQTVRQTDMDVAFLVSLSKLISSS